jgi:hypothetical protein
MVCLRNISVDTLHKGDTEDNNNNNNNCDIYIGSLDPSNTEADKMKKYEI